jgi:hypothetical protein
MNCEHMSYGIESLAAACTKPEYSPLSQAFSRPARQLALNTSQALSFQQKMALRVKQGLEA